MKRNILCALISLAIFTGYGLQTYCFATNKAPVTNNKYDYEKEIYKRAQIELEGDMYQMYRVVERLARANKFDTHSWQILCLKDSLSNKENTRNQMNNLITFSPELSGNYSGEISVMAFIAAREMAHSSSGNYLKIKQLLEERNNKLKEITVEPIKTKQKLSPYTSSVLNYYLIRQNNENVKESENKVKEVEKNFLKEQRKMEQDADKKALIYMIKAGFDPNAAIKAINSPAMEDSFIYKGICDSQFNQERTLQIKNFIKTADINSLKSEGKKNIAATKPLLYSKIDKKSLIIKSGCGSVEDVNDPFKKLFGK